MTLIAISIIIATVIFVVYNVICLELFGVPHSLSMTYYLWKETNGKGWIFSLMMYVVVALMMPAWIVMSEGSDYQFLAFLAPASLLFVATAPGFLFGGIERKVHEVSAYLAAAFSCAWIVLITPYWVSIPVYACLMAINAIITSSYRTSLVYWLECIAFGATFTATILYSLS